MKSFPGQTTQSEQEGGRKTARQAESDGDLKLCISWPRTVDTDGPEVKLTQEGKKTNQRLKTQKLHPHQLDFLFKMQRRPRAKRQKKNHWGFWRSMKNTL